MASIHPTSGVNCDLILEMRGISKAFGHVQASGHGSISSYTPVKSWL